jgi:hypothetical protein
VARRKNPLQHQFLWKHQLLHLLLSQPLLSPRQQQLLLPKPLLPLLTLLHPPLMLPSLLLTPLLQPLLLPSNCLHRHRAGRKTGLCKKAPHRKVGAFFSAWMQGSLWCLWGHGFNQTPPLASTQRVDIQPLGSMHRAGNHNVLRGPA